jgi:hypothetical protein
MVNETTRPRKHQIEPTRYLINLRTIHLTPNIKLIHKQLSPFKQSFITSTTSYRRRQSTTFNSCARTSCPLTPTSSSTRPSCRTPPHRHLAHPSLSPRKPSHSRQRHPHHQAKLPSYGSLLSATRKNTTKLRMRHMRHTMVTGK